MKVGSAHYRRDLDGLRFLSIVLVVLYHAGVGAFAGGYVGVDVFFVLSGYLITGLLIREQSESGSIDLVGFFARRIRRLLPLAAVVMITTLLVGGWLLAPVQRTSLITDARWASLYAANWRFGSQAVAYSETDVTESLLLHYWSLSIEEQFYFFWPLIVLATVWFASTRSVGVRRALFVSAGVITALSLAYAVYQAQTQAGGAYFASFGRFWEMGVGALLAIVLHRIPTPSGAVSKLLLGAGLIAIGVSALTYSDATAFPGYAALLPVLGTVAVVVAGHRPVLASDEEPRSARVDVLGWGPLPALGRLSYGWYLWHWPLIGFALLAREKWDLSIGTNMAIALGVGISLVLAWATHHLIENPIRHAKPLRVATVPNFALGAVLMLIPILGGLLFLQVGDVGGSVVAIPELASAESDGDDIDPITSTAPTTEEPAGDTALAEGQAAAEIDLATTTTTTQAPLVSTTLLVQPMTPEQAAGDSIARNRPEIRIGPCFNSVEGIEIASVAECELGDPDGDKTVILLGDSHMQHLVPAAHLAAKDSGWRLLVWGKGACPVNAAPLWSNQFERPYTECTEWQEELFAMLETQSADGVILGRSFKYFDEVLDDSGQIIEDQAAAVDAWSAGHAVVHERLSEMFGPVVVVRDTPFVGKNAATCLSENIDTPEACAITDVNKFLPDSVLYGAEVAAVGEDHHYDLSPYICAQSPCQLVTEGGVIKFRDWSHITGTFSTTLAPVFVDLLDRMVDP